MKNSSLVDEELVIIAQDDGNPYQSQAQEELLERYRSMVKSKARSFYLAGGEQEDVMQEGMIGLFQAICSYSPDKGASFSTYANCCVKGKIIQAVMTANREKYKPLNSAASLDDRENRELMDKLDAMNKVSSPEDELIEQETSQVILQRMKQVLSRREKLVLECYLQGLNYQEMAQQLGCSEKSIDNAIQRIRKKL